MRILELFGGIGACTKALKRLGLNPTTVDYVEIDKYAVASYNAINGTNFKPQDICEWGKDIKVDLIMHGSPCQDFSVAGLQQGGDENNGTRSSLMYESVRIIKKLMPKYVVWENVKNVLSAKHRHNFDKYLGALEGLGYQNFYQVLNAKDYGVPQNRERVFVISTLSGGEFNFPEKQELKLRLKDLLDDEVDEKFYLGEQHYKNLSFRTIQQDSKSGVKQIGNCMKSGNRDNPNQGRIYDKDGISPTLSCMQGGGRQPYIAVKNAAEHGVRKLTPQECWRLMGFDDEDFYKAEKVNSNTQLYKQAGNSIVVNVLEAIFKNLLLKGETNE